jgi:hypothetical protein
MAIKFTDSPAPVSKKRVAEIAAIPDKAIDTSDAPDGGKRLKTHLLCIARLHVCADHQDQQCHAKAVDKVKL